MLIRQNFSTINTEFIAVSTYSGTIYAKFHVSTPIIPWLSGNLSIPIFNGAFFPDLMARSVLACLLEELDGFDRLY